MHASADPILTSWFTKYSTTYARVQVTNGAVASATWPSTGILNNNNGSASQSNPAYSDVQSISYTSTNLYITASGVASYTMGPWYGNSSKTQIWGFWPLSQNYTVRITRSPVYPSNKITHGGGMIGMMVNGVAIYDLGDAFAFVQTSNTPFVTGSDVMGATSATNPWWRDAISVEVVTFDPGYAHQPGLNGQYHYHAEPKALRYQLGDNMLVSTNTLNGAVTYSENLAITNPVHSPILGWAFDGCPIYGPYGYSVSTNASSPVTRMRTGFVLRNGTNNTVNLNVTGRKTLPKWAAAAEGIANPSGVNPVSLPTNGYGPATTYTTGSGANLTTYSLGRYVADNDYLGDLTNSSTGTNYKQGIDFDLDQYNGRTCVTPDYPNGIYAYFVSIDTNGSPAFPYMLSKQYYGSLNGGSGSAIPTNAVAFFNGGPSTVENLKAIGVNRTNGNVTLTWSSVEGGAYSVQVSTNLSSSNFWGNLTTNALATTNAIQTSLIEIGAAKSYAHRFYRIIRTSLAAYSK